MANPLYGQNKADNLVDKVKTLDKSVVSGSVILEVTHTTNYDIAITQPAKSVLKDVILVNDGAIVTNGSNDLDMSMGAASSYTDLMAATALLDDGGGAVTWAAKTPLYVIENSHGHAANGFLSTGGVGPSGGPATTEAIVIAAALYSAASRTINIRFTPLTGDLTTAGTRITAICVFQYIST